MRGLFRGLSRPKSDRRRRSRFGVALLVLLPFRPDNVMLSLKSTLKLAHVRIYSFSASFHFIFFGVEEPAERVVRRLHSSVVFNRDEETLLRRKRERRVTGYGVKINDCFHSRVTLSAIENLFRGCLERSSLNPPENCSRANFLERPTGLIIRSRFSHSPHH